MPKITLKSLKEERDRNRKSNQEFIDFYVEYMKTHGIGYGAVRKGNLLMQSIPRLHVKLQKLI